MYDDSLHRMDSRLDGRDLDRLAVRGIEAFGHHGVFDFERRDGQVFVADLVLGLDCRSAARSDDLRDTVDYGSLVAKVKDAIESGPVLHIGQLAESKANTRQPDHPVPAKTPGRLCVGGHESRSLRRVRPAASGGRTAQGCCAAGHSHRASHRFRP